MTINRQRYLHYLAFLLCFALIVGAFSHGPIHQLAHYHDFADQSCIGKIPHFFDVVSNIGFAITALLGLFLHIRQRRSQNHNKSADFAKLIFIGGLFLTACGSSYYHLSPDNQSLIWDRLPITITCASLLTAVWANHSQKASTTPTILLVLAGFASVWWWNYSDQNGSDDLRPYLLFQILPVLLIPLWQWAYQRPKKESLLFFSAIGCYFFAKLAEILDHWIALQIHFMTGHTLKHILATIAALFILLAFYPHPIRTQQ